MVLSGEKDYARLAKVMPVRLLEVWHSLQGGPLPAALQSHGRRMARRCLESGKLELAWEWIQWSRAKGDAHDALAEQLEMHLKDHPLQAKLVKKSVSWIPKVSTVFDALANKVIGLEETTASAKPTFEIKPDSPTLSSTAQPSPTPVTAQASNDFYQPSFAPGPQAPSQSSFNPGPQAPFVPVSQASFAPISQPPSQASFAPVSQLGPQSMDFYQPPAIQAQQPVSDFYQPQFVGQPASVPASVQQSYLNSPQAQTFPPVNTFQPSPTLQQPDTSAPNANQHAVDDDFGFGNGSVASSKPEVSVDEQKSESKKSSVFGSLWGWLGKGEKNQSGDSVGTEKKAVKANLGEDNRMRYDEQLGRWVMREGDQVIIPDTTGLGNAPLPPPPNSSKSINKISLGTTSLSTNSPAPPMASMSGPRARYLDPFNPGDGPARSPTPGASSLIPPPSSNFV